jgi:iron(III) transport system permease protein
MNLTHLTPRELLDRSLRWPAGLRKPRLSHGFLLVACLLVVALVLLPVVYLLVRVLSGGAGIFAGWFSPAILATLIRTLGLAVVVTAGSFLLGIPLAWLTVRSDLPFRRILAVLLSLPLVIPSYIGAYLFVAAMGPRGMVYQAFGQWLGLERLPSIYGFPGAVYVLTLLSFPYVFLMVRAALRGMEPSLEEAGRSLGLNSWAVFWRITLPQLRPALTAGGLLVALYTLRDFGAVTLLRYDTFTRVIYVQYKSLIDRSAAASTALMLILLAMIFLGFDLWSRSRRRYTSNPAAGNRGPALVRLGRKKWLFFGLVLLVVFLSLLIPLMVLVFWLLRGWEGGAALSGLALPLLNSVLASGLGAVFTLFFALPVVLYQWRYPGQTSRAIDRVTHLGFALPGIVVALALVFFTAQYLQPVYQTIFSLTAAYVILFLPQASGALQTSLRQVHPSYLEAARGLGRNPIHAFLSVTVPLLKPGIAAGAGLVFLTAMKELPATLILSPLGFKTLSVAVWSAVGEAFFARAAAPALLLVIVSSFSLGLILWNEEAQR